jgi:hypothetical protein
LKRVKRKQICVAADDVGCLSTHGKGKKLVVFRVSASAYLRIDLNPMGLSCQSRKKASNVFLIDVTAELRAAQHLVKLRERREGEQDCSLLVDAIQGRAWLRSRRQQCAHKDICI